MLLSEINPEVLPPAVRHGIPPVLSAKLQGTYWNEDADKKELYEQLSDQQKCLLGGGCGNKLPIWVQDHINALEADALLLWVE